jgi:hypothetical protein
MANEPDSLADIRQFFGGMARSLERRLQDMPDGTMRDEFGGTLRGFKHLEGMTHNSTERGIAAFIADTDRARTVGLSPHTLGAISHHIESFRLGLLSHNEFAHEIKAGMELDVTVREATFGSRRASIDKRNAEDLAHQGAPPAPAATPAPALSQPTPAVAPATRLPAPTKDNILAAHARKARQDLAKLGHTHATPGDGPSVTLILKNAAKDARAGLAEIDLDKPGGLRGVLNKLGELKKPGGGSAAAVVMGGLISAAALLGGSPQVQAAEPPKDRPGAGKPKPPGP